jgi:hypothetical protein
MREGCTQMLISAWRNRPIPAAHPRTVAARGGWLPCGRLPRSIAKMLVQYRQGHRPKSGETMPPCASRYRMPWSSLRLTGCRLRNIPSQGPRVLLSDALAHPDDDPSSPFYKPALISIRAPVITPCCKTQTVKQPHPGPTIRGSRKSPV